MSARRSEAVADARLAYKYAPEDLKFDLWRPAQLMVEVRRQLARALAFDADILFMDEPFGALDEISRHWVLSKKKDRVSLEQASKQVYHLMTLGLLKA